MDMEIIDAALKAELARTESAFRDKMSWANTHEQNADEYQKKADDAREYAAKARAEAEELQVGMRRIEEALVDLHDRQGRGRR